MASIFISYSHKDQEFRSQLEQHLALLRRQGHVSLWTDHCIRPGEALDTAINVRLGQADIVLLLVSADFVASDYCYGIEMGAAMKRHVEGSSRVIPVILRPCDWHTAPFGKLKALPEDGKPITKWPSLDDGFYDVARQLRADITRDQAAAVEKASGVAQADGPAAPGAQVGKAATTPAAAGAAPSSSGMRSSNLNLPRKFTDLDRSEFKSEGFKQIRSYFQRSLAELEARNPHIKSSFLNVTALAFTATLYDDGEKVAGCTVRLSNSGFGDGITFSNTDDAHGNSFNEMLSVENDKFSLGWKPMMTGMRKNTLLSHEGAADCLWDEFILRLQQ